MKTGRGAEGRFFIKLIFFREERKKKEKRRKKFKI